MTPIKTFDYKGNYVGDAENHLGLAYAFGDGKETSCQYMVDAVSNLFYGIPINSYVALNMEAVEQLNDAVGRSHRDDSGGSCTDDAKSIQCGQYSDVEWKTGFKFCQIQRYSD